MNEPSPPVPRSTDGASARTSQAPASQPVKSRRTATWARSRVSDDGCSRYSHNSLNFSCTGLIYSVHDFQLQTYPAFGFHLPVPYLNNLVYLIFSTLLNLYGVIHNNIICIIKI